MVETHTFPCPNCKEIINDSMKECRYCHVPIDPQWARAASDFQSRVNDACSDASYLKTAAYVMVAFLVLDLIPFVPLVWMAYIVTFFAVIFLIIRWQTKYGSLRTPDPDYKSAVLSRNIALVLWIVAMPVWVVGNVVGSVIIALLMR